jgi:hypothetical protein
MPRNVRRQLIADIEQARGSRVITYVTGDRPPVAAQIGDDAIRPIYEQLRTIGHVEKLDLFIYSRGGAIDVPWRIASALREAAKEWAILVPFRANSAATLLALGADSIVMGRHGELGPIDPIMDVRRFVSQPNGQGTLVQEKINVEDLMSYVRFARDRAGLSDQAALAQSLAELTERVDAVTLGNAYRTHSHIRDVARRILLSRKKPPGEQATSTIVETLAERVYAHGHAINLKDATDMGLPAKAADAALDAMMWSLLEEYERDLKLLSPIDPAAAVAKADVFTEADAVLAVIESATVSYEFTGAIEIRAKRQTPPTLNLNLNLSAQLPAGIVAQPPPPGLQQLLQQVLQQLHQALIPEAQKAVFEALKAQAPLAGCDAGFRDASWRRF